MAAAAMLAAREPGNVIGRPVDQALQLPGRDDRAGEGDRADQHVQDGEDRGRLGDAPRGEPDVVVDPDQGGGAAADRVEDADQLRHGGHLDRAGHVQAGPAAEQRAGDHHDPAGGGDRARVGDQGQRGRHGEDHARGGHLVAAPRGGGGVHQVQPEHEAGRGRHVEQLGNPDEGAHAWPPLTVAAGTCPLPLTAAAVSAAGTGVRVRRNILSIRPVTT